jgi:septum formation protein
MKLLNRKLILASGSPRRVEILRGVGWEFEVIPADIDETRAPGEDAVSYVKRLAHTKAETVAKKTSQCLVLGADTVVVIGQEILGQPRDDDEARRMLKLLSGQWHEVLTGVALVPAGQSSNAEGSGVVVDHETTRVLFAQLSDAEIDWYVSTGEPRGKAGAYAIQGRAALFIEEVRGDYFNIVGLPVRLVYQLLGQLESSERAGASPPS